LKITHKKERISSTDDLTYFDVEVIDKDGNVVPKAVNFIQLAIKGNSQLQTTANGNPIEMRSFLKPEVTSFRGHCQVIVRSFQKEVNIEISARSEGLASGTSIVHILKHI
jgi:beta-galactosidase